MAMTDVARYQSVRSLLVAMSTDANLLHRFCGGREPYTEDRWQQFRRAYPVCRTPNAGALARWLGEHTDGDPNAWLLLCEYAGVEPNAVFTEMQDWFQEHKPTLTAVLDAAAEAMRLFSSACADVMDQITAGSRPDER